MHDGSIRTGASLDGRASDVTMIHLSVFAGGVKTIRIASEPYFRVTGGAIWTRPEERLVLQIREASWEFGQILWKGMRFIGRCRLIFGVQRDVEGVSTEFDGLTVERKTLYTKGIALATYDAAYDSWWSLTSEVRCHAFRIESAELAQTEILGTREFASGFPSRAFI
jgi:hypothetical protein